ncbi:putative protein kinase RLK-Pelle-LRR-XII-1 family [Helianthus annuus]|nr:putative protein kinase RLK-Pelle-LRR-XII-1 family [Helianthus annuus]
MAFKSFMLLPFLILGVLSADSILEDEANALKQFKNLITDDPTGALLDWNADSTHHCNWTGIQCHNITRRVIAISIQQTYLKGQISPFLGNLSGLQLLDLSYNSFTGNIPFQLGYCTQLSTLSLYTNSLSGPIPSELGKLRNLQTLDLGNNSITGIIFVQLIGDLANLQLLGVFNNLLEGWIPPSIGHLKELQVLDLSQNQISGIIPREIGNLLKLQTLQLFENSLSGNIPTEIVHCKNLTLLNLYSNKLTGSIPGEIGNLQGLQFLRLYDNHLNSTIPRSLFQLKSLILLGLSKNNLTGNVSSEISSLESLQLLTLHENRLTGEIPASITSDFGTARILGVHHQDGSSVSSASTFQGTIGYLAPEFAYMRKVTTKVDVFSFGVIMMEFITRKRPTELPEGHGIHITLPQLIEQAISKGMTELIEVVDPDLASDLSSKHSVVEQILQLALCCTRPDPDDRPYMNEILSSLTKISKKV